MILLVVYQYPWKKGRLKLKQSILSTTIDRNPYSDIEHISINNEILLQSFYPVIFMS